MKKLITKKHSDVLTSKEIDTLDVYAENPRKEVYEIAGLLGISTNTLNIHLKSIRRKLNIPSGKALVAMCMQYVIDEKDNIIKNLLIDGDLPPSTPAKQAKVVSLINYNNKQVYLKAA